MSEQKRKNTILEVYVPVSGLADILYCHEMDFQRVTIPLFVSPSGTDALKAGIAPGTMIPMGAALAFHIVNAFIEIEDSSGEKHGKAIGQIDIYGTIVTRPIAQPSWWKEDKHQRPGLGNVIKLE